MHLKSAFRIAWLIFIKRDTAPGKREKISSQILSSKYKSYRNEVIRCRVGRQNKSIYNM